MAASILSRYLNPEVLSQISQRHIEPRGLVIGNLAGSHKSPLHGFAVEFAGHREYVPGDDPKHIDWRVFYTRDKLFIKQYEMETNFVCHLVLDTSASMRYGDDQAQKLLYAAQMATTIGHCVVKQSDKVSLTTFDTELRHHIQPGNSMGQIVRMTEHLDTVEPVEKTSMTESVTELIGRIGRREIVMIFSDFFTDLDDLEEVLQRMKYQNHEVVLFQIMHHDELAFDMEGMVKFKGLEDLDEFMTQPEDIQRAYLKAMNEFNEKFDGLCQKNQIERVLVDTSRDMAEIFIDYLNQRSLLNRGR